jgi:hypothetical protein
MFFYYFGNVFEFTVLLAAFVAGGRDERIVGAAQLLNIACYRLLAMSGWSRPEWLVLAADAALLAVLLTLAMRTTRWWLLWGSAFQLLIVVIHLAMIADPTVRARSYATGTIIWAYLVFIALAVGIWGAWRARRTARATTAATAQPSTVSPPGAPTLR